ncbi:N-acetyltransferase family protein [Labrys okinawensis]|uniref:GNAT family N-acetyltransferase n=1 Tax=Labrys okinawensis TaxID=346911 RepID=UPI0039BCF121
MFDDTQADNADNREAGRIAVPGGVVYLRRAEETDASFLFDLFREHTSSRLRIGGLPEGVIEQLVIMQYRARAQSFRDQFPDAWWSVIESAGVPIGELIVAGEPDALYVVDIALNPGHQQQGIGSALMRTVMADGAVRGGVRAMVMTGNEASLRMFRRLGFSKTNHEDGVYLELRWRPAVEGA